MTLPVIGEMGEMESLYCQKWETLGLDPEGCVIPLTSPVIYRFIHPGLLSLATQVSTL